ncbi:MAG: hypothetical protein HGA55_07650 [Methanoregulaceae archaeon]|nr:hypothetical protein [Methanoregulaceae archaeon]
MSLLSVVTSSVRPTLPVAPANAAGRSRRLNGHQRRWILDDVQHSGLELIDPVLAAETGEQLVEFVFADGSLRMSMIHCTGL